MGYPLVRSRSAQQRTPVRRTDPVVRHVKGLLGPQTNGCSNLVNGEPPSLGPSRDPNWMSPGVGPLVRGSVRKEGVGEKDDPGTLVPTVRRSTSSRPVLSLVPFVRPGTGRGVRGTGPYSGSGVPSSHRKECVSVGTEYARRLSSRTSPAEKD